MNKQTKEAIKEKYFETHQFYDVAVAKEFLTFINSLVSEDDRYQIAREVGAEFLAWAINNQDKSKGVGEVMCGVWLEWLDSKEEKC